MNIRKIIREEITPVLEWSFDTLVLNVGGNEMGSVTLAKFNEGSALYVRGDGELQYTVMGLGVNRGYLRKGYGKILMDGLISSAESLTDKLYLLVNIDNVKAINLYESIGFNNVGTWRNDRTLIMMKEL